MDSDTRTAGLALAINAAPNWTICACADLFFPLRRETNIRRYTGDLVKRAVREPGLVDHDVGSPKRSSPSLTPRRKTNRCRSAQRVSVVQAGGPAKAGRLRGRVGFWVPGSQSGRKG